MADQLLALSVIQPWLWAILEGYKPVENRRWKPWPRVIGSRIALHASLGYDNDGGRLMVDLLRHQGPPAPGSFAPHACPRGAILGTARLVGAVQVAGGRSDVVGRILDVKAEEIVASPWTFGPWAWLLEDVRTLARPIACKGSLGLWRVPPLVADQVLREGGA